VSRSEPVLNVPRSVTGAAALLTGMQIVQSLLPDEAKSTFVLALAFIPARYSGAAPDLPGGYVTAVTSFVTYMTVHAGWMHLALNLLWMLAFGSAVARRMSDLAFVWFSVLCGIAGAFTHLLLHFGETMPVVGASAAISGQMAGAMRFMFAAEPRPGHALPDFVDAPRMSLGRTLSDKRFLLFLVVWFGLNALFGVGAVGITGIEGSIAWEAHVGGFLCGLLIFGFFDQRGRREHAPERL
jgi:membrane associated rhomboid family serine protease